MAENASSPEPEQEQETKAPAEQQPKETNKDARMWAMFCHLAGLCGMILPVVGQIVAPLILWQIKKDNFPFVDDQGKEALNFQISVTIYAIVSALLSFLCIGFFLLAAVGVFDFVFMIIAAIKSNEGRAYRYPLTIRLVK